MITIISRAAYLALAASVIAGCESPPVAQRAPRNVALIMSGDVVSYSAPGLSARISVTQVDGQPVKEPYGPVELTPGRHTVVLACDGVNTPHAMTVAAGEVYQFAHRPTAGKGCAAALSRVRRTNP